MSVLHYEVSALLGKGGMGEVFRATDGKLGRQVAIKVLPEEFIADQERIVRFEREARLLAALNHPNIASIHGVEDVDGVRFLVMELADGENLSDRLMRGPIPVDEAIEIALQIADALEVAHDKGIIHRDLKPANIKVNDDNRIQVLDFGLAKAFEKETEESDNSNSPTMVRAATHQGVILGTAAYMSPEQARGKRVDKRADIWAFGVVLWEMLTGKRLFGGETISDTLAAVLKEEPDWKALAPETPASVRRTLRRCLARNPKDRLRDIGDARLELLEASTGLDDPPALPASSASAPHRRAWLLPLVLILGLLTGLALAWLWPDETPSRIASNGAHLSMPFPPDARLAAGSFLPSFTFSPDGQSIAYVGIGNDGARHLYVRRLDEEAPRLLPGTEGAEGPFFSPDGEWIGFWSPWKIQKIRVSGSGLPETICDSFDFRGGTWAGNTIIFAPGQATALLRVPDSGGRPELFTKKLPGEEGHRFPRVFPDGDTILFSARPIMFDPDRATMATISLSSGERKDIGPASTDVRVSPTGHLLYVQAGRLIAVPLDLETREITGPATTIVQNVVVQKNTGAAQFDVSAHGQLAWITGGLAGDDVTMARVGRNGDSTPILEWSNLSRHPDLSPDGRRVLIMVIGPDVGGTWLVSTDGSERRRLTSQPAGGAWATEREWVGNTYQEMRWTLFRDSIDGSTPRTIIKGATDIVRKGETSNSSAWSISASAVDHRGILAFNLLSPETGLNTATVDLAADDDATLLLSGPANEGGAVFSPDGRYIAYTSDQSGQFEVYVTTYPDRTATWQISTAGGSEVVWRRDGKEIFYRSGDKMIAVPVTLEPSFHAGSPIILFRGLYEGVLGAPHVPNYDVAADGSWLIMMQSPELGHAAPDLRIALGWPSLFLTSQP